MPKTKRKARKKTKRKGSRPRLGLYVLAALISIIVMWILIREPQSAPEDLNQLISEEINARISRPQTPSSSLEDDMPIVEQKPQKELPREGETQFDLSIRKTAEKLGVPERSIRRRTSDNLVRFLIPIDRSRMDLTFANMIFKGELETQGAHLVGGADMRNKQTISFEFPDSEQDYEIDLYYDSGLYRDRVAQKTISIVVDDFGGISGGLLDGFFELDTEICFAIFPDEAHSLATMQRATRQGRETLIHVPMEPIGYPRINPGENAILVQHNDTQISRLLNQFISRIPDAIGINNHMGSLATTDPGVMQAVMNTLRDHDMAFLDSRTSNVSVAYQIAQKSHIKAYRNDIFLDSPNISSATMEAKLNQINRLSATQNHIIAITHCHSEDKLEYLKTFISRLKKAGFTLVPLSNVGDYRVPEII